MAALIVSRLLLDVGESCGFPAATRAIVERFAPASRATAMRMVNAGTSGDAVIAPPLIALLLFGLASWLWVFFVTGDRTSLGDLVGAAGKARGAGHRRCQVPERGGVSFSPVLAAQTSVRGARRSPEGSAPVVAAGARSAASQAEAERDAQVVITMLADDDASRGAWLRPDGALPAMQAGAVAIESSTLTHERVKTLAAEAAARGLLWLDAPVTGSRLHAVRVQVAAVFSVSARKPRRIVPGSRDG